MTYVNHHLQKSDHMSMGVACDPAPASEIGAELTRLRDSIAALEGRLMSHVSALHPVLSTGYGMQDGNKGSAQAPNPVMDSPHANRIQDARFAVEALHNVLVGLTDALRC